MKMKYITTFLFSSLFSIAGYAQTPVITPSPTPDGDEVVKITTKLVQFDAVVTDKDGKQVTDLGADDFEILQDGKPQKITSFSYVNTASVVGAPSSNVKKADKNVILQPPSRVNSTNAKRILTFVVDDGNCAASQIGMMASREALEKFVTEQMQPDDLVAVYQTRTGSSVFQQYTSDKNLLLRAARKIRWYPPTGSCATSDGSFYERGRSNTYDKITPEGTKNVTIESEQERKIRESSEDFNRNNQVVGTIGVLRYVIRGLEQVGGRKVVFLMSDGLPFRSRDGKSMSAVNVLRDLTDLANRSSVVFNTIDARGVFDPTLIEARDQVSTINDATASEKLVSVRMRDVRISEDGLAFLAGETGGNFYRGQNFLDTHVRRALSLERGYYLLAYEPDDDTFKSKNFNSIEIRSRRPGLKVLSRAGFVGSVTEAAKQKKRTGDSELYEAIVAPLPRSGLNLQLTAFFGNGAAEGNYVRSMAHLKGDEITFVNDSKGFIKAGFDVVAVTLNEKNEVVDEFTRTHSFKVESAAMPLIKQNGLIYTTDVPIKKAGTYNFRVAVRDASSKMLGSAGQIVQIPDLKKGSLFLSALTLTEVGTDGKFSIPSAVKPENALSLPATAGVPAIRRFRRGMVLAYAYTIYNAKFDTSSKPKLSIQTNLYHNGKLISEGKPTPADIQNQADWSRINDYTYLRLNPAAEIGDYALQIIVKDLLASGKSPASSQWVDFEVVE